MASWIPRDCNLLRKKAGHLDVGRGHIGFSMRLEIQRGLCTVSKPRSWKNTSGVHQAGLCQTGWPGKIKVARMSNCPTNSPALPVGDSGIPDPHRLTAYLLFGFSHVFLGILSTLNLPNRNVIYPSCSFPHAWSPWILPAVSRRKTQVFWYQSGKPPKPRFNPFLSGMQ